MAKRKKKRRSKSGLPPGSLVYTGDRDAKPPVAHTIGYSPDQLILVEAYTPEQLPNTPNLWVDVRNISDVDFVRSVGERFGIHPLALEDVLNTRQRAKLDEYAEGLFIVLPNIQYDETWSELRIEQISMFLTKNALVTFQEDPDDTFAPLETRLKDANSRMRRKGPDYLAYAAIDTIVDNYFIALDEIESVLLEMENAVYNDLDDLPHFKSKIFNVKHLLNQFRNKVLPLRDAINRLYRAEGTFLIAEDHVYIRDVADHVAQVLDQIENYRDQLINVESLYLSGINNRMNNVMKLLTVISTIFIPLSFVAGVYGMNFEYMPELKWRYGYFMVLGLMFTSAIVMLIWFRIKKWI